jgi:hypothetical protein
MNSLRLGFVRMTFSLVALFFAGSVVAGNVAIVQGGFYTTNLRDNLITAGHTVTEIPNYTAASLAAFDAVIQDGNSFLDIDELRTYAEAGGRVILIPWSAQNWDVPADMQVLENSLGDITFSGGYPGVDVFIADHPLLQGVTFPDAPAAFNIGRINDIQFVPEAIAIAEWGDGVAGFLGTRAVGSGFVIHLNMHIITSDTAYQVIDQDWAITLVTNLIGGDLDVEGDTAGIRVTKTFSDGLITDVEVSISCNDGFVNADTATITSGDPAGFRFVITDFIGGSMDCEITEAGTEGYTSDSCSYTGIAPSERTCNLLNEAEPGTFSVTKTWDIMGAGQSEVDQDVILVIDCDSDISNPDPLPCDLDTPDSTQCVWTLDWDGLGLGDSVTASVDVDTTEGDASCTAYEMGVDSSEVESVDTCEDAMVVEAAGSNGCEITNTVFFEGIPTLSQYGLALMALLMLGVGMVGFRRFA